MATVIELGVAKEFSQEEVNLVLPVIGRITKEYKLEVETLLDRLEILSVNNEERIFELEKQIDTLINDWKLKIKKLGAKPRGLWSVDFDSGRGYFCWKFPSQHILQHHRYADSCNQRAIFEDIEKPSQFSEILSKKDY